ncbi:MAG: hypothetical protein MUF83_07480 [Acidimicrobiales bacterium]|jgi:hypothetical protein|nr:hypothetical protein [Acidimicrobiales bacterium]
MPYGLLSDRGQLESLFDELAEELTRLHATAEIVMVGGAWMLWHLRRASTRDVDSARRFGAELAQAADRVGDRHHLRPGWLNDDAAAFWPSDTDYRQCAVAYTRGPLLVRVPRPDTIFVMKLYRAAPHDREDLVALWPRCTFEDPDNAVEAFKRAYPHAPEDEHLAGYITEVAHDAEHEQPSD